MVKTNKKIDNNERPYPLNDVLYLLFLYLLVLYLLVLYLLVLYLLVL